MPATADSTIRVLSGRPPMELNVLPFCLTSHLERLESDRAALDAEIARTRADLDAADAFTEGAAGYLNGVSFDANPFETGERRRLWAEGYLTELANQSDLDTVA